MNSSGSLADRRLGAERTALAVRRPEQLDLDTLVRVFRRRARYAITVGSLVVLVAVTLAQALPEVFRSTGRVAVESQQIPAELVRSTVTGSADARIGFVRQIVMTDARLAQILDRFDPYPDERGNPKEEVIDKLRRNIEIEAVRDPYNPSPLTIAFTVSYDHTDPVVARDVAEYLVQLFLDENTRTRSARARETAAFLRQEAERLSEHAKVMDRRVAEFKQSHSDALPEHLDLRVSMLERAESELHAVQREIATAEQERRFLQAQKTSMSALLDPKREIDISRLTPAQRVRVMKADLDRMLEFYQEGHPDVLALRRSIARASAEAKREPKESADSFSADPVLADIESRVATIDAKLASLTVQQEELRRKMVTLQDQILRTPEVELGLRDLTFGYESALRQFDQVRSKQQEAEIAQNLESEKMAERFVLLEPPAVPMDPVRPNRIKLIAIGLFIAIAGGIGAAFALELLDRRIRDPHMLSTLLGERPLAAIPVIASGEERRRHLLARALVWTAYAGALLCALAIAQIVQEPLHTLLSRFYP